MSERFSASQASKFRNCHASANLDLAIPNWTPPEEDPTADNAANRGTYMHGVFASVMGLGLSDAERMVKAIEYVNSIRRKRRFKTLVEVPEVADWLPSKPGTTADLVLYLRDELHVFDLKTGQIPVRVTDNDQMLFYAATYAKYAPAAKGVSLHIVQPWAGVMEMQYVGVDELRLWMQSTIDHDLMIRQGSTTFGPGDHCLFCPANPHGRGARGRPLCPAMLRLLYPEQPLDLDGLMEGEG